MKSIDLKIHLWDFYREDVDLPVQSFTGPRVCIDIGCRHVAESTLTFGSSQANVFTLAFSSSNRYLFSLVFDFHFSATFL